MTTRDITLPNGGVVRIKPEAWAAIQKIAVTKTIREGKPVKESTIVHELIAAAIEQNVLDLEDDESHLVNPPTRTAASG